MSTPKSAKRRPWLWIGLSLILAAGLSTARKASARVPSTAVTSSAASAAPEILPGVAQADADTLDLQLD
ncbi:MAG TPA: hypothetical protein VGH97_11440 [Thermoanaerobaculia bacterium]|jgi:hypothetical protein